jgi:hypothetical protein
VNSINNGNDTVSFQQMFKTANVVISVSWVFVLNVVDFIANGVLTHYGAY